MSGTLRIILRDSLVDILLASFPSRCTEGCSSKRDREGKAFLSGVQGMSVACPHQGCLQLGTAMNVEFVLHPDGFRSIILLGRLQPKSGDALGLILAWLKQRALSKPHSDVRHLLGSQPSL